jgi:ion channel POLLUX/CASTOR
MNRPPAPRPLARTRFLLERFLLRGPQYHLLFIAAVIGLISVLAGALVMSFGAFDRFPEAAWWAFLRLTDPGYLGDDQGTLVRVVSTFLTVAGYVVFLGSLVAIMTQWLNSTIDRLERGLTPVTREHHVVILGWTNRTLPIVRELLLSEDRVRRFLTLRGARALHIVILADEVTHALRHDMREQLGRLWDEARITLRSGSRLRADHLDRVDLMRAGVVVIPGSDLSAQGDGAVAFDTRTVKTLLSMDETATARGIESPPMVVAEIHDSRKVAIARRGYRGPAEFVASDAVLARLAAQNLRHAGLSHVYGELLAQGAGNEIYLPEESGLAGAPFGHLQAAFPKAVVLGLVRTDDGRTRPILNPPAELRVEAGDRIVTIARKWGDVQPRERRAPGPEEDGPPAAGSMADGALRPFREEPVEAPRRILVLGWSLKVAALLREFATYRDESWQVDVFSRVDPARRAQLLERQGLDSILPAVRQLVGDLTVHSELIRAAPFSYDGVVLLGGDTHRSGEEADARTLLGALLLRELAEKKERVPTILVELLDPANQSLLARGPGEVLVTPILVSHVLAQVALRPELRGVFDELFTAGGPEIAFQPVSAHGLAGPVTFADVRRAVARSGQVAVGIRSERGRPRLNPAPETPVDATASEVVVLAASQGVNGGGAPSANAPPGFDMRRIS